MADNLVYIHQENDMDDTKQMIEKHERKCETAIQIALATGVLKECEYHERCFFKGNEELKKAYVMANNQYSQGEHVHEFKDRKEMTDIIREVVDKYSAEKCSSCGHFHEE